MKAETMLFPLIAVAIAVALLFSGTAWAQDAEPLLLWPDGAPGATGETDEDRPTITPFLLEGAEAPVAAMVVCPGGGYGHLAGDYEGADIARRFNEGGTAAFVLRYRHAPGYKHPIPINDAKRAIRTVRARAAEWNIDPARVGILGFSAGGHLAGSVATLFDEGDAAAADPIDRQSAKPAVAVLCYPVITLMPPYAHMGSRNNLLGQDGSEELVRALSLENAVGPDTPPMFLFHTADDAGVDVHNSLLMFEALRANNVPAELHVFEHGRHGVGLAADDPQLSPWMDLCINWLRARNMAAAKQ